MQIKPGSGMATLGTVFTLVLVLVVLGFSLSAASVTHLHLNTHNLRESEARSLARSAVASAIEKFFQDSTFGANRSPEHDLEVRLQGTHSEAQGVLTFVPEQAGVRYSTNNFESTTAEPGDGKFVAPGSLHLIGVGQSGGVTRSVEAVIRFTLFPQAIASSGPVISSGPLLVATLGNPAVVGEANLLPADILSNGPGAPAITLADGTKVTGDVQSVGTVELPASGNVDVWGEVRDNASPEDIVTLDPLQYDPVALGLIPEELSGTEFTGPYHLEGAVRTDGDMTVQGDLVFDGGLLFVGGNLQVTGKVTGTGILACDGGIKVDGGAGFTAGQKVAMLAKGRVELQGSDRISSYFQGLIYTRGGISAQKITVIGALVNDGGDNTNIELNDARVFYDPAMPELSIETVTLPEVLVTVHVPTSPAFGYIVTVNPADPPQLEYFRYEGDSLFGPGVDPDEARRTMAQQVQGQTPDATFEIPESLLAIMGPETAGGSQQPGQYGSPGGAITPGSGMVPEITNSLAGLQEFHAELIAPVASELNATYPNGFYAEIMTGFVIRGFDRRNTDWMDGTGEITRVGLTPSEILKPNEHNRLVLWKED